MNKKEKILNYKFKLADEAAQKLKSYQQRSDGNKKAEQVERIQLNALREARRNEVDKIVAATERVVRGKDESRVKPPSLKVETTGTPVARLHDVFAIDEPKGFGTGFLIAPNILITNHHVFEKADDALNCVANFKYQFNFQSNQVSQGVNFNIRPDIFFYTNEALDFALMYVEEDSLTPGTKLASLGYLPLIAAKGKVKNGDHINIIQYPQGGIKKYTTEDNEVFDINDEDGIIYYYTDTEPGSSGSPGFNDYWEVAALHYTGVPKINEQGQWLAKNHQIWDKNTMTEEDIEWEANAGKSASKIVSHLSSLNLPADQQKYIQSILANARDPLGTALPAESIKTQALQQLNDTTMSKYSFNFHGNVNFNINEVTSPAAIPAVINNGSNGKMKMVEIDGAVEKKERFDENYDNRKGYDEDFIPGFNVPVPTVKNENDLYKNFGASVPYIVPYHHYSLVMNKKRRMVMWTAANVDYNPKFRDDRERAELGNGAWRLDKRIPAKYQIQADEFYDPATLVDKGHIVRRDDNCWAPLKGGKSDSVGIEYANADTFHWTNCTPQHEAFNRDTAQYTGVGKWGVLENAIKQQLEFPKNDADNDNKDFGQRACVLGGPVLSDNDPEYMDIQYPLKFWKVFAIKSQSDGELVYGFLLSQEDKINETGVVKEEGRPRFNRMVKAMQVSLKAIEALTGVIFDAKLHEFDVKNGDDSNATESLRDDLSNLKTAKKSVSYNHN